MIRRILGEAMFIQKNSGLLKNDNEGNMTQNKLRTAAQRVLRTRWYLALVNLLIIGGAVVVPGELVLGEENHPCEPYPDCRRWAEEGGSNHTEAPQESPETLEQMQKRYPRAIQQLLKYDPRAIQKLRQALPILQKLQELAPESKEQIQQLILNRRRQQLRLNHRQQQLNQFENNKE